MDPTYDRYRTWFEGYGINTITDAQGSFLGDRRKMFGGLAGAGMTVTPGVTLGVSVDRNTTDSIARRERPYRLTQSGHSAHSRKDRGRSASPSFTASAT